MNISINVLYAIILTLVIVLLIVLMEYRKFASIIAYSKKWAVLKYTKISKDYCQMKDIHAHTLEELHTEIYKATRNRDRIQSLITFISTTYTYSSVLSDIHVSSCSSLDSVQSHIGALSIAISKLECRPVTAPL